MTKEDNKSNAEKAYHALQEQIANKKILPGQQIVENTIAEGLKMSRTPIREAVRRLQQDGLVEIIKNKGAFLKTVSFEDMANGYEIISVLMSGAYRLLAEKQKNGLLKEKDLILLRKMAEKMVDCQQRGEIKNWIELDIAFHRTMIELTGNDRLISTYQTVSFWVNQVLWNITTMMVDRDLSSKDHFMILDLIEAGEEEKSILAAYTHHIRTVKIMRSLSNLTQ